MMSPQPKIITIIGSLNTDLVTVTPRIPAGGETLTATSFSTGPGGKGANQAVACARLSRRKPQPSTSSTSATPSAPPQDAKDVPLLITMHGRIGDDSFGPPLISSLQSSFINTTHVSASPTHPTGTALILIESATGENRILLSPGANHSLLPSHYTNPASLGTPLPDLLVLQLEIPLPTVLQIITTARSAGVDVLLNPAPAPAEGLPDHVYNGLKHLIMNESEAALLSGVSISDVEKEDFDWESLVKEQFLKKGVENVVVTLGAKGAFYMKRDAGKGVYVEAEKNVKVVDTTAAGDTFVGAYAVGMVRGVGGKKVGLNGKGEGEAEDAVDGEAIVRWACKAASKTVERKGAQEAIPWGDEVDV